MAEIEINKENREPYTLLVGQRTHSQSAVFLGLALVLLIATFFYSYIIPQTPGRMTRISVALVPDLSLWAFITSLPLPVPETSWSVAVALMLVTTAAFAAYGVAVWISWKRMAERRTLLFVALTAVILSMISAFSYPNTSTDIFNYMANGRIAAVYNSNPYYVIADEFPDDPVYPYASKNYTGKAEDKMPFWTLTNVLLAELTGDNVTTNLIIYRTALLMFNLTNLLLIGIIAHRLNPLFLISALVIYGWNPVVIVHAQAKSDVLMALLLLVSVMLFIIGRRLFAVGALVLSILVKLITLPLFAVYMLGNLRLRRWRALIFDTALFFVVPLVAYLLSWQSSELNTRFFALFTVAGSAAPGMLQIGLIAVFCLLILYVSYRQDGGTPRLLWAWSLVMLYFSFFLTKFGLAWYLISLLAIVSLVFDWRIVLLTGALSFTSFSFNAWYSTFTAAFPGPEFISVPPFLVYILVPAAITTGIVVVIFGFSKLKS